MISVNHKALERPPQDMVSQGQRDQGGPRHRRPGHPQRRDAVGGQAKASYIPAKQQWDDRLLTQMTCHPSRPRHRRGQRQRRVQDRPQQRRPVPGHPQGLRTDPGRHREVHAGTGSTLPVPVVMQPERRRYPRGAPDASDFSALITKILRPRRSRASSCPRTRSTRRSRSSKTAQDFLNEHGLQEDERAEGTVRHLAARPDDEPAAPPGLRDHGALARQRGHRSRPVRRRHRRGGRRRMTTTDGDIGGELLLTGADHPATQHHLNDYDRPTASRGSTTGVNNVRVTRRSGCAPDRRCRLDAAIDDELEQWTERPRSAPRGGRGADRRRRPRSAENLGQEDRRRVPSQAFKAVGEKVTDRADDIQDIHQRCSTPYRTRSAPDRGRRDGRRPARQAEFPPSKPGDDETDEMHNLKVYVGPDEPLQLVVDRPRDAVPEHADKVETAWQDAIAVMEKVPDDQTGGGGPGGGSGAGTGPIIPAGGTPARRRPRRPPPRPRPRAAARAPRPPSTPTPPHDTDAARRPRRRRRRRRLRRTSRRRPRSRRVAVPRTGDAVPPSHRRPRPVPRRPGLRPRRRSSPTGGVAPTPRPSRGSLSGMRRGRRGRCRHPRRHRGRGCGAAGVGAGASGGLRSGGVLGASGTHGRLGARHPRQAGGAWRAWPAALPRAGTGRGGSRGSAGAARCRRRRRRSVRAAARTRTRRSEAPTVELFDEDRDWIDDEGASSGVID